MLPLFVCLSPTVPGLTPGRSHFLSIRFFAYRPHFRLLSVFSAGQSEKRSKGVSYNRSLTHLYTMRPDLTSDQTMPAEAGSSGLVSPDVCGVLCGNLPGHRMPRQKSAHLELSPSECLLLPGHPVNVIFTKNLSCSCALSSLIHVIFFSLSVFFLPQCPLLPPPNDL